MGVVFATLKIQRYEMIIRLSGREKKPGRRLSVQELSIRKISFKKDFKKIRNAEMGISLGRQMRSEYPLSQIYLATGYAPELSTGPGLVICFHGKEPREEILLRKILLLDLRNHNLLLPGIFSLRSGSRGVRQWLRTRSSDGLRRRSC